MINGELNLNPAESIENLIKEKVNQILSNKEVPDLSSDVCFTDNIAEVIEKLCIVHIRMWMLEDAVGVAKSDQEIADLKRKIDICFKQKRPQYVQAVNKMIDSSIKTGKSLVEDSVKLYKGN